MILDINTPQSKSITVFVSTLKYYLLIFSACLILSLPYYRPFVGCNSTVDQFASTSYSISKGMLLITLVVLIYFYCNWRFPRTEFYIYLLISFVASCFLAMRALIYLGAERDTCYDGIALTQTILIAMLLLNITTVFSIVMPLELSLKCQNTGGSLIWPALWLIYRQVSVKCSLGVDIIDIVTLVHLALWAFAMLVFIIVKYTRKTNITAKCWRWTVFISWIAMIACYITVLAAGSPVKEATPGCAYRNFLLKMYVYCGWV